MTIVEKTAYLKGLTDGLGVGTESKEGKLWAALNDVLSDIAHELEELHETDLGQAKAIDGVADELSYLEELCGGFDSEDGGDDGVLCGGCYRRGTDEEPAEEADEAINEATDETADEAPDETADEAPDETADEAVDEAPDETAGEEYGENPDEKADEEPVKEHDGEIDDLNDEEDEEPEYDGVVYDATCPVCGEEISFDEETLNRGFVQCPNCGETLEFELGDEEGEPKPDSEEIPF